MLSTSCTNILYLGTEAVVVDIGEVCFSTQKINADLRCKNTYVSILELQVVSGPVQCLYPYSDS